MRKFYGSFRMQNKYYLRIVLSISLVATLLVCTLSAALYVYGKDKLYELETQKNSQLLNQTKHTIEQMDAAIRNIAVYLFVTPDATAILNNTGNIGQDEIYSKLNRISASVITSNTSIQSIGFYNSYNEQYYYAGKQMYYDDAGMKQMIVAYPGAPRMKPIFRAIENDYGTKPVKEPIITYLMYESSGDPAKIDSAVAINLNPNWIMDNLKQYSFVNEQRGESAYIYSDNGGFLEKDKEHAELRASLIQDFKNKPPKADSGSIVRKLSGERYVISYLQLKDQSLTIFKIQPISAVYGSLYAFRTFLTVIVAIFVLIALLFSLTASGIVYTPILRLLKQVSSGGDQSSTRDEISFLSKMYDDTLSRVKQYDSQRQSVQTILKSYALKSMLLGEQPLSRESFEELCREHQMPFAYDGEFRLVLVKMDEFAQLQQRYNQQDRQLIKYAIGNIMRETLLALGQAEETAMQDDELALLLPLGDGGLNEAEIVVLLETAQAFIKEYYRLSVTVSVSGPITRAPGLPDAFRALGKLAAYRFVIGTGSVITADLVRDNAANRSLSHSARAETILLEHIEKRNYPGVKQSLDALKAELVGMKYEHMVTSIMHLVGEIRIRLKQSQTRHGGAAEQGEDQLLSMLQSLGTIETIEECFAGLQQVLQDALDDSKESESASSQHFVVDTVQNIIQLSYADNALCLDGIASTLKMPSRKLAKLFKDAVGISIGEQINEVRLSRAAKLFETGDHSVYEVLVQVGYENQSYFYKLFRTRFGMTPKEYAARFGGSARGDSDSLSG
ncbi:AraC family transcriptional regulator [Paenibacillus sacheonensis]|uniref:Helix-turn-helix domain-containing protein n=1 Tax=Paenibacillus sacheonensis TaxID=742054 RepID=A0A7X4YVA6_9BACL|nr:helix-turn-helix domain-containing protein [Paenibacillus sacheonensis]MBM7568016.1 AraC-like DNA-binding protein [Paenibacillus sacheonensis]NBC73222.1 helix-turn-helix domain-containing protein [Paenibacillus sacheonensis]